MESHKKLYQVLDLYHTFLNSTGINDMTTDEDYLKTLTLDRDNLLLFSVKSMGLTTKLANDMFDMYIIYTKGDMAKLLDPKGRYFSDRIISRDDGTVRHKKSLDVVMGNEEAVLFVDESKIVWPKNHGAKKYITSLLQAANSLRKIPSLLPDESESDGALSTVLNVLKRTLGILFEDTSRDVRSVLKQCGKQDTELIKLCFLKYI